MKFIRPNETDDLGLLREIDKLLFGLVSVHKPAQLYVVCIDNWFNHNWLEFSGKMLGALGVWKDPLTLPPFVPNRVLQQQCFIREDSNYRLTIQHGDLHKLQPSAVALRQKIETLFSNAVFTWYSSNTLNQD